MSYQVTPVDKSPKPVEVVVTNADTARERAMAAFAGIKKAPEDAPKTREDAPKQAAESAPSPAPSAEAKSPSQDNVEQTTPPAADPRLQELERKERLIREAARKLQTEKAQFEATKAQPSGAMTAEQWKAKFLEDPTSVGIGYQEMADKYLTQPSEQDQVVRELREEISALKQQMELSQQTVKQAEQRAYENAKKQLHSDARDLVTRRASEFEAIAADGAYDAVVDLIEATYREDGYFMSVESAAKQVEDYLTEKARKYAGLKKLGVKSPDPSSPEGQVDTSTMQQTQTQQPSQTRTLSHSMSQATRPLTPTERREKAIAAFYGRK